MRYPKVRQMMGNMGGMPKPVPAAPMPAMPTQHANPFSPPRSPQIGQTALGPMPAPAAPGMRSPRSTLPSIGANANEETPIELGDPKRLAKIATILRMGRK